MEADVPLCLQCCSLVEMEEHVLICRLQFWLLAHLLDVRSYAKLVVAAFRHLGVGMLPVFR